ncbi:MAG TPA: glycosyltransferase family 4 protein, partial [Tepidisphaeraceae bacterium]|nr:glycosyltransferase family 4 protein [Tepidisphaeraceae bacterium]
MGDRPILGYLTSAYARASDTFIRGEVRQLRALGFTVHTFSIRRAEAGQIVSDDVRREQGTTEYLLDGKKGRIVFGALGQIIRSPGRCLRALALAQHISPPGLKPRLWHIAYWLEAAYLAGRLQSKAVEHLHNHIGENSATVAMLASQIAQIPFSLTIHGPNEFDHPMEIALGEKIRRSTFVAAISSFGRSQLWRWCAAEDWGKIRIVHCGVDADFLGQPIAPPPAEPRLVSIGRLSEQKGQLVLIEAASVVARRQADFELVLIGDGPMRPDIEGAIAAHNLQGNVRLAGWMDSATIRRELLSSRALVMPSFAEGLPVVIMESLALGRPVLSTSIAGIPELVKEGVNGWLVPAGSAEALAEGMLRALSAGAEQLAAMGRAGMEAVSRDHNAAIEAAKLAQL